MHIRTALLFLVLTVFTGCSKSSTLPFASNLTQTANLNTAPRTNSLAARSQRLAPGETPAIRGYNEGYNDGSGGFPSNPTIGINALGLTNPADIQNYTDAYNRGYSDGRSQNPSPSPSISPSISPSPSPTGSVSPDRQAQLRQSGYQDGLNDARLGLAANPGSGIAALGLTDPAEQQIYTNGYNLGYQRQPSPSPTSTAVPGRLTQIRQQGRQDGANDARDGFAQDPNRGINLLGITAANERQAYTNAYINAYQQYIAQQGTGGVPGSW